jgi:ATP diphosphatase
MTTARRSIDDLLAVMAALRTPGTGCPWDLEQDFRSIAPYTIEEAYEVADAIERGDRDALKEELGDLLLQVVYHARMAEEQGAFAFADVVEAITAKMLRRHPHVFGNPEQRAAGAAPGFWERIKAEERAEKPGMGSGARRSVPFPVAPEARNQDMGEGLGGGEPQTTERGSHPNASPHVSGAPSARRGGESERRKWGAEPGPSVLDGVPVGLPALTRAVKLQDKAARVGFDWPSLAPVFEKLKEELAELEEAIGVRPSGPDTVTPAPVRAMLSDPEGLTPSDRTRIEEEFGDLLFVVANVARHLKIDPETALRSANHKFTRRFHAIERSLAAAGRTPAQSTLAEMDRLWDEAKAEEP